ERQTRIRALPISVPLISILSDDAKKAVFFVCDSSREKHSVGERQKIPQAVKLERRSIGTHERLDESLRSGPIVNVNESVTEITDPKVAAFHESKSPGGIEVP